MYVQVESEVGRDAGIFIDVVFSFSGCFLNVSPDSRTMLRQGLVQNK